MSAPRYAKPVPAWIRIVARSLVCALENRVHAHDLHATVLHLMGLDHEKLTCRYGGRDYRLTDVSGRVIRDIIA